MTTNCGFPILELPSSLCKWTQDEDGNYETECGEIHVFIEGGPAENKHVFCPYCGNKITQ